MGVSRPSRGNFRLAAVSGPFALIVSLAVLSDPISAQEASTTDTQTTFGIEQLSREDNALRALFERQEESEEAARAMERQIDGMVERQARLESAARALQRQLSEVTTITNDTAERLARGDEPLVSLEIEQLWAMVRSLERYNADLREEIAVIRAGTEG